MTTLGLVHLWLLQQFRATSFPIRWPVLGLVQVQAFETVPVECQRREAIEV
jgi:hypothetical protein